MPAPRQKSDRPWPPDFCSARTMAALLDISVRTFRRLVREGAVPPGVPVGNRLRWDRERVASALRQRQDEADDEKVVDPIMAKLDKVYGKAKEGVG